MTMTITKEKEEDDSSIAPLMEMFRCVSGKNQRDSNDDSSSKRKTREEKRKRKQHSGQDKALFHE